MILNKPISVITVCFNSEKDIETTIKNVLRLNFHQIDHIIIDGGSKDRTVEIIKKYEDKIKYWISEPDNGIYDAMNKGWHQALDDSFVLFLGAGDLLVDMPRNESFNEADIIAGKVQIGNKFLFNPKTDIRLKLGNTVHHQALLIKKSLHISAPFNLSYKTYADFDFNQRLVKSGHKIFIDPDFKGYALEGGISTAFDKEQSLAVVRSNFGAFYVFLAKIYYYFRHEI